MMAKWSREHVLAMIHLYKSQPFLYDPKHNDYFYRDKREMAFREICSELRRARPKTSVADIKARIKTLRSQYTKERQKMDKWKQGEVKREEDYEPKLWCFENLSFLEDYIICKEDKLKGKYSIEFFDKTKAKRLPMLLRKTRSYQKSATETSDPLPIAKKSLSVSNGDGKEEIFGRYVTMELKQITDVETYNETKWNIQTAIMDGIRKQRYQLKRERVPSENCIVYSTPAPPSQTDKPVSSSVSPKYKIGPRPYAY